MLYFPPASFCTMQIIKKSLLTLLIFFLLTAIILWMLARSINPIIIKDYLNSQISLLTKQKSQIRGDLAWQLFPRPGLKITNIEIGEQSNNKNYFIKLDNVLFKLKLTPLLRGKIIFSEFNVNGFTINTPRDVDARNFLSASEASLKNVKHSSITNSKIAERFAIERSLLSHGQINIVGENKKINLTNLQIGAEQFNLQKLLFPIQLKGKLSIFDADKKNDTYGNFTFAGSVGLPSMILCDPIASLNELHLNGLLNINDLNLRQIKINKLATRTQTKNGILKLSNLTAKLYSGETVGDLYYDYNKKLLTINHASTNINLSELMQDLGHEKVLQGSIDFSVHAKMKMNDNSWQDNISGNGSLTIKDGVIESIDFDKIISGASQIINDFITNKNLSSLVVEQFANLLPAGSTNFKLFTLQYEMQNAKLQSNSIKLQTNNLQLTGESSIDLKNLDINSHLLAKVILANFDHELGRIQQLLGGSFPIYISGSLYNPVILPDLKIINSLLPLDLIKAVIEKNGKMIDLNKIIDANIDKKFLEKLYK